MKITESDRFKKEFKKLSKKYNLDDDFKELKKVIKGVPTGNGSKHWNVLKKQDKKYILKVRMTSRYLKKSAFRVIYFYDGLNIEILFIEIYFKSKKENEDHKRIEDFWKKLGD